MSIHENVFKLSEAWDEWKKKRMKRGGKVLKGSMSFLLIFMTSTTVICVYTISVVAVQNIYFSNQQLKRYHIELFTMDVVFLKFWLLPGKKKREFNCLASKKQQLLQPRSNTHQK